MDIGQFVTQYQFVLYGVIASVCAMCISKVRAVPIYVWNLILDRFRVQLEVSEADEAFKWIKTWLARQDRTKSIKTVSVFTGYDRDRDRVLFDTNADSRPKVFFTPSPGNHKYYFEGKPIYINRHRPEGKGGKLESLEGETYYITFRTKDISVADRFMAAAKDAAIPRDGKIEIRTAMVSCGYWRLVDRVPPRHIDSIIMADGIKEDLIHDIRDFMDSFEWYSGLGIPYRRGYMLYGPPGNGKSSLVSALAGHFKLNINILSLGDPKITDSALNELLCNVYDNSIVLFEDVDSIFAEGMTRKIIQQPMPFESLPQASDENPSTAPIPLVERLTFSGLLNALDGIACKQGRIIFMTTNHPDKLDPALVRPGRIDKKYLIGNAAKDQAVRLFRRFYKGRANDTDVRAFEALVDDDRLSMAFLQGHFMNHKDSHTDAIKALNLHKEQTSA